jgi:periplasmic divalent cation tolerance protein
MTIQHDIIIIIATLPNEEEALTIARKLVASRFAACVQLSPIQSIYRWHERIEEEAEVRLLIKTTEQRFNDVAKLIRSHTKYQCPEIMSYRVHQGTDDYLDWIMTETKSDPGK